MAKPRQLPDALLWCTLKKRFLIRHGLQSLPPWHCMVGGAVEQFSEQAWSGLQYHCTEPLLMHDPAQCLWGVSTGSMKVAGASCPSCDGAATAVERRPAMESRVINLRRVMMFGRHGIDGSAYPNLTVIDAAPHAPSAVPVTGIVFMARMRLPDGL
ncbi:hypothetical protein MKK58_06245 [Methylobacterium sp. J-078]|uniref:hypothetical protein n=1 Tax=Methylobacterium sp. J-078 TaxID=2836657 RepID=UPI001FB889EB|nr:hypothetical protein [Methylobacterium sp. J-078]MCJ2044133.1 hypothetical protein [Methylobacterium sp. J-078]